MSGFIKECFFASMMFFGCNLPSVNSLKCISMNNQECKGRPQTVNVNSEEPVFFPFRIKTSKCSVVVTMSMIRMQNCVFLMLLKIQMFEDLICQERMKQDAQNSMKRVNANVDSMQVSVTIGKVGIKINVGMNVKN